MIVLYPKGDLKLPSKYVTIKPNTYINFKKILNTFENLNPNSTDSVQF